MLVDDKGDYRFTLSLITAKASQPDLVEKTLRTDPKPLVFDRVMPYFAIQHIAFPQRRAGAVLEGMERGTIREHGERGFAKSALGIRTARRGSKARGIGAAARRAAACRTAPAQKPPAQKK